MKLYYPLTINLYKIWPLPIITAQQNNIGRGAVVTLVTDETVVTPDEEAVNFYTKRPDGYISYLPARVDGAKIYCDFTNQMLLKPGRLQVEIQMISGTEASPTEITTPIFLVDVQPSNIDESAIEGQNEFTALQQALAQTSGAVEGANEAAQRATSAASSAESAATSAESAASAASSAATAAGTAGTAASEAATAASSAATAATEAAAAANAAAALIPELKPIATSGEASDVAIAPIAGMTATNVQGALAEQYSKLLSYNDVRIPGSLTIDNSGYKSIPALDGKIPLFCTVPSWSANTGAFNVLAAGGKVYLVGTPGVTVTNFTVRLWRWN